MDVNSVGDPYITRPLPAQEVETSESISVDGFWYNIKPLWDRFEIISFIFSIFLLLGTIYCIIRYNQLREEQKSRTKTLKVESSGEGAAIFNERWEKILEHAGSANPSDWRLAILEADIMLDEMMTAMGYTQDTLGDKLKAADKNSFTTVDLAWEAHKVRNQIAHTGTEFPLDEREVSRIIELYRQVFSEFQYI